MLKAAIIGAGAISTAHMEGYLAFADRCTIVAVCDAPLSGRHVRSGDQLGRSSRGSGAASYCGDARFISTHIRINAPAPCRSFSLVGRAI